MTRAPGPVLAIECRKLARAPLTRITAVGVLVVVSLTSIGGYAAAVHSPGTELGRKAASLLPSHDWTGYTALVALGLGVTILLGTGIVMAWDVGREFTESTIVGLFAVPTSRAVIAATKAAACTGWGTLLVTVQSTVSVLGGIALGLPYPGAATCWLRLMAVGLSLVLGALPVLWVSTRWRGELPGIGAALGLVIVTNLAAGFGVGGFVPWSLPVLWATPGSRVPTAALLLPAGIGIFTTLATCRAWARMQLGRG